MKQTQYLIIITAILFYSCANTSFTKQKFTNFKPLETTHLIIDEDASEKENPLISSNNNELNFIPSKHLIPLDKVLDEDCGDLIILKNEDEIKCKILEVNQWDIVYKKCSNLNGPAYTTAKEDIFMIKYQNGQKETFYKENKKKPTPLNERTNNLENSTIKKKIEPFSIVALALAIATPLSPLYTGLLVGLGFGILSLIKYKRNPEKYKKASKRLAISGIATSIFYAILILAIVLIFIL